MQFLRRVARYSDDDVDRLPSPRHSCVHIEFVARVPLLQHHVNKGVEDEPLRHGKIPTLGFKKVYIVLTRALTGEHIESEKTW